jgi:hypothetical protein
MERLVLHSLKVGAELAQALLLFNIGSIALAIWRKYR